MTMIILPVLSIDILLSVMPIGPVIHLNKSLLDKYAPDVYTIVASMGICLSVF